VQSFIKPEPAVRERYRARARNPASDLEAISRLYAVGNRCACAGDDFDGCLDAILDAAIFVTNADKGNLQLRDSATGGLLIRTQRGFGRAFLDFFSQVNGHSASVCSAALDAANRVTVEDVTTGQQIVGPASAEILLAEGVRAVQSTPLVSSTGHVMGMVSTHFARPTRLDEHSGRFMDLLARQAADYLERKETERLLLDKQAQLERITEHAGALITLCSRDLRYLFVNKPYADLLGKPAALVVGRRIPEIIGEAAFEVIGPYIRRVLAGERVEYEAEVPYASVGLRCVHVTYAPDVAAGGQVHGWIATITDVTERQRLEQQLRIADRQKDDFLAILAHELRNPLAPIRYALAAAKKGGRTPEQQAQAEDVIERQVAHMTRLLDDLLDVSRITRGSFELKKCRTSLASVVEAAIEAARPVLDAQRHTLAIALPGHDLCLEADPVRLAQVFSNLLINAAKYTNCGGQIQLRAAHENDEVAVSVRDNGIGISRELMPRLFTLFVQGRATVGRTEGGLGVGLSLVREIVERHGGRVEVSSAGQNQGSEFTVRLPVSAVAPLLPNDAVEQKSRAPHAGVKILVADDNRDAADSCAALLGLSGHQVHTAYSGQGALELAETFRPDALLLDIGMPDMDGYALAGRIRGASWGKTALLVAVTGWGQETDRERAFAAGFDHHFTKPVVVPALEAILRSVSVSERLR